MLARASKIVDAYEAAEKRGLGVIILDGDMIDAAVCKIAEKILARKD